MILFNEELRMKNLGRRAFVPLPFFFRTFFSDRGTYFLLDIGTYFP